MLKPFRSTRSLFLAAAAFTLAACGDDPMAPATDAAPRLGVLKGSALVKVLERTPHLKETESASLTISAKEGGTLSLPNSGLVVSVPAGAIRSGTLTITVTATAGKSVAYDFQPHGTVFLKALTVSQHLEKTTWKQLGSLKLYGGYYPEILNDAAGTAVITEAFPVRITTDSKKTSTFANFDIKHFSGYIVSTGRADGEANASLEM